MGSETRKVQLFATKGIPVQHILRDYYTSCVLNFITWNKAFSMFPHITFIQHKTVPLEPELDLHGSNEYAERGWTRMHGGGKFRGTGFPKCVFRQVGDASCWNMTLDTDGVRPSSTPDFVMECNGFRVGVPKDFDHGPRMGVLAYQQILFGSFLQQFPLRSDSVCKPTCRTGADIVRSFSLRYQ